MSYNTRRNNPGFNSTPQQSASAVGQRRPVVTNNFVSGGQLAGGNQQQKPGLQTPQQQRPPQQQQSGINFRSQQLGSQTPQQQSNYQSQSYSTQQQSQQARYQQGQQVKQQTPVQQPQPVQQQLQQTPKPAAGPPVVPDASPSTPEKNEEDMDTTTTEGGGKKKPWFRNRGKISKAEKVRRRNVRLSKILQPKNAVMILNELVKGCQYTVDELPCKIDANQFRASVVFEEQEFAGAGRTKNGAKNSAAETALKFLVKNKQLSLKKEEDSEDVIEKMEIGEEDGTQVMPWTHIASFAMYKLFSAWGEDPTGSNKPQDLMPSPGKSSINQSGPRPELKPAKKMPDNPEKVNPLMLMNQMLPHAQWDEVGKSGAPPNVVFTFSVKVDGKTFTGTGTNKKAAKKLAAFAACHDILKITYPAEVWVPLH